MRRMLAFVIITLSIGAAAASPAQAGPRSGSNLRDFGVARFEGRWIDLSESWEGARACLAVAGRATRCFRSRGEMRAAAGTGLGKGLNCGSSLDLYGQPWMAGSEVSIYARGVWINLSSFGFDNATSSYVVGACSVSLASGANGGGSLYPRCLSPGCAEFTMLSGWDNVISSVYLH
jgi:hypothetical protein